MVWDFPAHALCKQWLQRGALGAQSERCHQLNAHSSTATRSVAAKALQPQSSLRAKRESFLSFADLWYVTSSQSKPLNQEIVRHCQLLLNLVTRTTVLPERRWNETRLGWDEMANLAAHHTHLSNTFEFIAVCTSLIGAGVLLRPLPKWKSKPEQHTLTYVSSLQHTSRTWPISRDLLLPVPAGSQDGMHSLLTLETGWKPCILIGSDSSR